MSYRDYRTFYFMLVKIFVGVAAIGVIILIYANMHNDPSTTMFSLIAFVLSVAALVMTTLQSVSIARQVRLTQKSVRLVSEASRRIESLIVEDKKMEKEIVQDLRLDHAIIAVLEEYGIGDDQQTRAQVADKIARTVKSAS
jgi:hypothetical protein